MPFNIQLFDRIRAATRAANIFRQDNIFTDQDSIERVLGPDGEIITVSRQSALLEQTNLQINRLERYKDYDMMDEVGEISLALDMYADESSLIDPERKHSIIVKAKNLRVRRAIEDFLYNTILIDAQIRPMVRYLCKYGDAPFEIVPTKNRDGVSTLRFINVYNFTRVQTKYGDLIGFYYQDMASMQPVFLHPWQVMHMRLTSYETIYTPYGRSILDGGRKDFKRLRLMEDAALVYRLTRAPEKRVFSIPVGQIPTKDIPQHIMAIAREFKKHQFVDPATGQVNERYNPLIQDDDFFLPKRPGGEGPTIERLQGAENLDQIADIEYFKKKMVAGLKIPFSRVGIGQQSEPNGRSLAQVSPEFAKNIQWIQREVTIQLKKAVIVHLALRGYSLEDVREFDLYMTAASAIDELYRIETWNTRADVIGNLKETGLFPDEWILESFTDLSRDEIEQMQMHQSKDDNARLGMESSDKSQNLLLEYTNFLRRKAENDKNSNIEESNMSYLANQNEFDGLTIGESNEVLFESVVPENEINDVKKETILLLMADESDLVVEDSVDDQVLSEEVNKVTSEED